jgi:OmpA-OmpF porin, OOP family
MKRVLFLLISLSFLSGCTVLIKEDAAMTEADVNDCMLGASLTGTTIGAFASPLGAGAGTVVGALLGYHFCGPVGVAPAPMVAEQTGFYWPDDQDFDGVIDADDNCPFTPEGIAVDSNGCAEDHDGDGVPYYLDKCPETPLGTVVNLMGCAIKIVSLKGVHFAFDSATLTSTAKSILDGAIGKIKAHSSSSFTVEGHTDSNGSDDYNYTLSQSRANAVMNYLISKGVPASSLSAVGKGENNPITSNDTKEGRAENRRVDVLAQH